jgi:GDPmannose 4,6-dehydratase
MFEGSNEKEVAKVVKCTGPSILEIGKIVVEVDSKYYRPTEVDLLIGDATKAKEKLGWEPKYKLDDLVKEMVNADYNKTKSKINKDV